jgi:LuxR family maltose regulon positive regulatory protein
MAEAFPIIQTKLYRPPLQADFVPRPQLLEQLDGWQLRPLTLVSAPAGYGKPPPVRKKLKRRRQHNRELSLTDQQATY